tara:strand:- start:36 stop:380 length:345 start_codon:yes stop_codon:yes gene_type:complete
MPDEITIKAINLLREADPNLDEMGSMDKFLEHQFELARMRDQYVSYSNHPQAEKMKKRLEVFEESSQAFTWVYFMMLQYKREKVLANANELEMANAVIELKNELNILTKLNKDD